MPAVAPLEDLEKVNSELVNLKSTYPEVYSKFQELFKNNRKIGYKNICKLLLEEATPKKLKGLE